FEVGFGTTFGVVLHDPVVLSSGDRQDAAVPLLQNPQDHLGGLGPVLGGGGADIGGGEGDVTAAGGVLGGQQSVQRDALGGVIGVEFEELGALQAGAGVVGTARAVAAAVEDGLQRAHQHPLLVGAALLGGG